MNRRRSTRSMRTRGLALALLGALAPVPVRGATLERAVPRPTSLPADREPAGPNALPLEFEENVGQGPEGCAYLLRSHSWTLLLSRDGAVFDVPGPWKEGEGARISRVRMRYPGSGGASAVEGRGALEGRSNYFLGRDPARWRTGVRHFSSVEQRDVFPGVTVRWSAPGGRLKYDFLLAPGADPDAIRLAFHGASRSRIDARGDLALDVAAGIVVHRGPLAYQSAGEGREVRVPARFAATAGGGWRFQVGAFDRTRPLVIDPWVDFSTYYGAQDKPRQNHRMALGPDGSVYVTGRTPAAGTIPTDSGLYATYRGGDADAYVARIKADFSGYVYSTYLGGNQEDQGYDVAVDSVGAAYVLGHSWSLNYPTKDPIYSAPMYDTASPVLTKVSPVGDALEYSTFIRAYSVVIPTAIALDSERAAYLVFKDVNEGFPFVNPIQEQTGDNFNGGLVKVSPAGDAIVYGTAVGGSKPDSVNDVFVDAQGRVYLVGTTETTNLPVQGAYQATHGGGTTDAFLVRVASDGSAYEFFTYLGGSGADSGEALRLDPDGNIWVGGSTASSDLPTASPYQASNAGGTSDAFLAKLGNDGDTLLYGTYLGGTGADAANDVAIVADGTVYVAGSTGSAGFPTAGARQGTFGGGALDAFLTRFASDGASLVYSSFLGGAGDDAASSLEVRGQDAFLAGSTTSSGFPLRNPLQASNNAGNASVFVTKVVMAPQPPTGLDATLLDLTVADVAWQENSDQEDAVEVERSTDGGAFALLVSLPPDSTGHVDSTLVRGHDYAYRVRAVSSYGGSLYTNVDSVFSPPIPTVPPAAPSGLGVQLAPTGLPLLQWTDNSIDEEQFQVNRSVSGATFSIRASVISGTTSFLDATALPDRTIAYGVRAVNSIGTSAFTAPASIQTPPSLDLLLTKGKVLDSTKVGKDVLQVQLAPALLAGAREAAFFPPEDGLVVRLGGDAGAALLNLGPADPEWRQKKAKFTWKSPRDALTKVKVIYDSAKGTLKVTLSKLNFATPPANPVLLWVGSGNDAGHSDAPWLLKKPGLLKYPVPVPK